MKIKYCIWDVGCTLYAYSLKYFKHFCMTASKNFKKQGEQEGREGCFSFPFDKLMLGSITFPEFCQNVCNQIHIDFNDNNISLIDNSLRKGINPIFPETLRAMRLLKSKGIKNAILSNALPNLAPDTMKMIAAEDPSLVAIEHAFTSYELHLLKPDPEIFKTVLKKLDAKPQEVLFVDNDPKNVQSARSVKIPSLVYHQSNIDRRIACTLRLNDRERT